MRAVVLAGGLGMRLRPYTTVLPKPLIPIGDRPILELIVHRLASQGVRRVELCIGHLGELIQAYFSQASALPEGLELGWHREDARLGTAGALRLIDVGGEDFLAMNGDVLTDLDVGALMAHHRGREAALTVAIQSTEVKLSLGAVELENGLISRYREKPTLRYDVSLGVYAYAPRALAHLPDGPCDFPELVERLIAAGERVAAFRTDARCLHISTVEDYERALQGSNGLRDLLAPPDKLPG